jgi:3D-(3,5/4)-trihydroxycyclohexane-1,2-dione acylhydrolase (decyclizing)
VLTGHKLIVLVCDNGGFGVINRLQNFKGVPSFNNLIEDCRIQRHVKVDFAQHAESMGALARKVTGIAELEDALRWAKTTDRTTVITMETDPYTWTPGDAWWDVGVPEVSDRQEVRDARKDHEEGRKKQRVGV